MISQNRLNEASPNLERSKRSCGRRFTNTIENNSRTAAARVVRDHILEAWVSGRTVEDDEYENHWLEVGYRPLLDL